MDVDTVDIDVKETDSECIICLKGKLNTFTYQKLSDRQDEFVKKSKSVVMDLSDLVYISSAGLRVILSLSKALGDNCFSVRGAKGLVKEVFELSGFDCLIKISE